MKDPGGTAPQLAKDPGGGAEPSTFKSDPGGGGYKQDPGGSGF